MNGAAVFLDRDGVINDNWLNPATGEWESPIAPDQLRLCAGAIGAMKRLQQGGYFIFLVSNQPSAAKGKCSLEDLHRVHAALIQHLSKAGVQLTDCFYAYGHPEASVAALRDTTGRKPDPYFLEKALTDHRLIRDASWMVGDRDTDILCGQNSGVKTIQVKAANADGKQGKASPDFKVFDLAAAAELILSQHSHS